jgi:hypothetical protein
MLRHSEVRERKMKRNAKGKTTEVGGKPRK